MVIEDIQIFYEDGYYTADIKLDSGYIVTEGKTFDELMKMMDDAFKGLADGGEYKVERKIPAFTFNFSHNATHLQAH